MKLFVRETGNPKGPVVVLLHAFPMSGAMWEPQVKALEDYRVLIPDLRGFGGTKLEAPWLIEHAAADVLESFSGKAAFVGLSMGGYVALQIAATAPDRVTGLVLCDTRAEADANENKAKRAAAIDFVRNSGVEAFLGPFLKDAVHNQAATASLKAVAMKSSPDAVMAALSALAARPDATPHLGKIMARTAIFVGSYDKITPLPLSEAMKNRIAGAELHLIPDAGHFSNAENPAVFNDRLVSFLKRL
ncbi:MAG: alpha/beta hydrolase [Elusimicrobiota bacterium]|nr:MAG: alpha/beta hydrolase [Elusimicrobiota bacterium]